jgi:ABC-type glycerol-3-phosphate transport system substrate-binding protein
VPRTLRIGWPSTYTDLDLVLLNLGNDLAPERQVRGESIRIDLGTADYSQAPSRFVAAMKAMASGMVPDLIVTDVNTLGPLAHADLLQDLAPLLRDQDWFKPADFYGNGVQAGQSHGKQVALPFSASVEVLLYNRRTFQERGIAFPQNGWSWDQLVTAAKALTTPSSGGNTGQWGFSISPNLPSFWTMAWQRGAQVVSDDGAHIDLGEPGTLQAMGFLTDLIQTYKVAPRRDPASLALQNVSQVYAPEYRDLLAGALAMAVRFTARTVFWRNQQHPSEVAVAELPSTGKKVFYGYASMLSIPAAAPDPPHSLNGLRAMLDASALSVLLPARKGSNDLRTINQLLTESEATALTDALSAVRYLPTDFPLDGIYGLLWSDYLLPILTGQKDPAQAANDAQPRIQGQLTRLLG